MTPKPRRLFDVEKFWDVSNNPDTDKVEDHIDSEIRRNIKEHTGKLDEKVRNIANLLIESVSYMKCNCLPQSHFCTCIFPYLIRRIKEETLQYERYTSEQRLK